jgi:heme exporter protein D
MTHFLAMGGYAAFVWPAYGVSVLAIGALIVWTILDYRSARRRLAALEAGEPR